MRSQSRWGALLLAAGVLLTPAGAIAQMGVDVPPDPIFPFPLYHPRADVVGGVYTALEFVMYRQTNPIRRQLIAVRGLVDVDGSVTGDLNGTVVFTDAGQPFIIRGPIVPGNFIGTGTPALYTDDLRGQESYQPGYKMTLGYRFNSGSAIELNWTHLQSAKYTANASLIPPNYENLAAGGGLLADTYLFAPFFNLPKEFAGPEQELALGNPGATFGIFNAAVNMAIDFQQRYDEFNVRGRVPCFQDDCTRIYGMAGGRFAWIYEKFRLRTVAEGVPIPPQFGVSTTETITELPDGTIITTSQDTPVVIDPGDTGEGPQNVAIYSNIVSNRMYGPFAGFGFERYIGYGFAAGIEMEGALLLDIVKERAYLERGDGAIKLKKAATNFAVTPQVAANVQLYWYPAEGIQLRAGYNFSAFFNTVAAQDPIAFDARSFDPNWTNRPVRFLDGFNAGFGFIF